MEFTIVLTPTQEKALVHATAVFNKIEQKTLTPQEFFTMRATEQLDRLIASYRERMTSTVIEAFNQKSPLEQAAILQQLGITL